MNYEKIYNQIIKRAKHRLLECYTESHHIIPECIGGPDTQENKVDLTPEEHYICHQLLVKMHPKHRGLAHAAVLMCASNEYQRRSNKTFGWLKRRLSEAKKKPKVKITCQYCGEVTYRQPSQAGKKYCNKVCFHAHSAGKPNVKNRKKKVECTCEYCSGKFYLPPWEAKKRKFCSRKCTDNWKRSQSPNASISDH